LSVDLASFTSEPPKEAIGIRDLIVSTDGIFVFDFDGVVCSSVEDDIYHLPPAEGEAKLLSLVANKFNINCDHMEQKYQRHLLFQASCLSLGLPIEPGVGFDKAMEASRSGKFSILTARSGWYAVERLRQFLAHHLMTPIEIFNVGRVQKDRQIDIVCKEANGRDVFYIEDNASHLNAVKDSSLISYDKLHFVWAERTTSTKADDLNAYVHDVLNRAASL
jgi:hypothetical protein